METFDFHIFSTVFTLQHARTIKERRVPPFVAAYFHFRNRVTDHQVLNEALVCNFGVTLGDAEESHKLNFTALKIVSVIQYREQPQSKNFDFLSVRHGAKGLRAVFLNVIAIVAVFIR